MNKDLTKRADDPDEIKSILLFAMTQEKQFTMWQRDENRDLLFSIPSKLISIEVDGSLRFELFGSDVKHLTGKEIFFAVDDSTAVFKTNHLAIQGNVIVVKLPQEARYRDRRKHPRRYYRPKDHKDLEAIFELLAKTPEQSHLTIKSKIIDISSGGACFLVSKETLAKINTNNLFSLKSLCDVKLASSKAKIMNAREYTKGGIKNKDMYAIGIMFF